MEKLAEDLRQKFPNWKILQLTLNSSERGIEFWEFLRVMIESISRVEGVLSVSSMSTDASGLIFSVEPTREMDSDSLRSQLLKLANDPSRKAWVSSVECENYRALSTHILGGDEVASLINSIGMYQSQAVVDFYLSAPSAKPSDLMPFTVFGSCVLLGAMGVEGTHRKATLLQQLEELRILLESGPGDEKWESSVHLFARSAAPLAKSIADLAVDWDLAASFMRAESLEILTNYDRKIRDLRARKQWSPKDWTLPFEKVIAKRFLHQWWLRLYADNRIESTVLGWLSRL